MDDTAGSACVFERVGPSWVFQGKLVANDASAVSEFGYTVDVHNQYLVVDAPGTNRDVFTVRTGAAYLFKRLNGRWVEWSNLVASDRIDRDEFGIAVAIGDNHTLIGAHLDEEFAEGNEYGATYAYTLADRVPLIPAMSVWGMVALALLVITTGTIALRNRLCAPSSSDREP